MLGSGSSLEVLIFGSSFAKEQVVTGGSRKKRLCETLVGKSLLLVDNEGAMDVSSLASANEMEF